MRMITRPVLAATMVVAMGLPAVAAPIEIATLGRAPLIGQSTSPTELRYNVKRNAGMVRKAADALGLSREQYQQFMLALDVGRPNFVTVPRHLDAMTWASNGQVHVLKDVIIPANQKGVEVDLRDGDKMVSLFMPARCGNLSVIRRNVPHVAAAKVAPRPVAARPMVESAVAIAPAPIAPVAAPIVEAPVIPAAIIAPVVHHSLGILPLLGGLLPFVVGGGGGGSTAGGNTGGGGSVTGPPPCPPGTDP